MAYFTDMNTEGFTDEDLEIMNAAHEKMVRAGFDPRHAGDLLNNVWDQWCEHPGELFDAATK